MDYITHKISTIGGNGIAGYSGNGGAATDAKMTPSGICLDRYGNIFFVDSGGGYVRKIDAFGIVSKVAGNGISGLGGDGGPATDAQIAMNGSLCVDAAGNLYLACDTKIRKVERSTGIITTFAGIGTTGFSGVGGPATAAQFNAYQISYDTLRNNLYIADIGHDRVYQVDAMGIFHLIAGNGIAGFSGDGNNATTAQLYNPEGITTDTCGNIYIADDQNGRIRRVIIDTPCYQNNTLVNNDVDIALEIKFSPNPVENHLEITGYILDIEILNLDFQTLFTQAYTSTKAEIDMSGYPAGVYIVRVRDKDGGQIVRKVVKE